MLRSFAIEGGRLRPLGQGQGMPPEAAWIDMVSPTPAEERLVETALGLDIPTRAEAGGLQVSDRLVSTEGALYMSALVPGPSGMPPTVPITFVRTGDRLVTVRYSGVETLDPFIARYARGETSLAGASDLFAGLLEIAVDRIAERLQQIGEALDHLSRGIFHHPANVEQRAGRPLPLGRRIHRLEAVIEDLGTQHELAGKLRECIHCFAGRVRSTSDLVSQVCDPASSTRRPARSTSRAPSRATPWRCIRIDHAGARLGGVARRSRCSAR